MRNVVFVHGFWHGSWCWSPVTTRLAARDIPSVAIDLAPGAVTARSAADNLIEQLEPLGPSVVVAHSMGGVTATAAAEKAPHLFEHLMYVAAFAPVGGLPAVTDIFSPENEGDLVKPLFAGDPAELGSLRIRTDEPQPLIDAFYDDVDPATAAAAIAMLRTDEPLGIPGEAFPVTPARYGAVPHSYVVTARDRAVLPALQHRLVKEIDTVSAAPTSVVTLDCAHSPFLSQPSALADAIAAVY
ncbi:alpha/beta fold hydrolase [Actinoplanes couchii]|uniref:AB hydrolase-1 domain-containing protein n=1 Tax=Actinoplanes couchii TaxID=403638 RepID=A0ABQ3XQU9_9ACTN|nr:alpha/beta fold hydrolase [Actinoplanes couchii]MDR6318850.1 pimeloyl-ACP methyl ester carboxylesterase [Actinoplanes couchii]GID60879.1 hypothetical protein Aco03nite_092830 [Actinoplanes couchii]